jgi:hypothetical protein
MDSFTNCYLSKQTILSKIGLNPNQKQISVNALLIVSILAPKTTWCMENCDLDSMGVVYISSGFRKRIIELLKINKRTWTRCLGELLDFRFISQAEGRDKYYINPWLFCSGFSKQIMAFRRYCFENKIFLPPEFETLNEEELKKEEFAEKLEKALNINPQNQAHSFLFWEIKNLEKFNCFSQYFENKIKRINRTELLLFFYVFSKMFLLQYTVLPGTLRLD